MRSAKPLVLCAMILVAFLSPSFSQSLWTVEFVSGAAEYQRGGVKAPVVAALTLTDDATLIVAKGALIELRSGDKRVSIVREGAYPIRSITATASKAAKPGLMNALGVKLRSIIMGGAQEYGVAGVRASDAAAQKRFMTGGDEARKRGEEALAAGDYRRAEDELRYALDEALPGDEGPLRTSLASALALQERLAEALSVMRSGERDESVDRDLLEASILVRAGAADEALAAARSIQARLVASPAGDSAGASDTARRTAEAAELAGLALEALDRPAEAAVAYRKAVEAAPQSQAAARAKLRLAELGQ